MVRLLLIFLILPQTAWSGGFSMQRINTFWIDRTEISIHQFSRFVQETGFVSHAERNGGGLVYAAGWEKMAGWTWKTPFGRRANQEEPAVHLNYNEASQFCQWRGLRLPSDDEWMSAAYTETRAMPSSPFEMGTIYPYPTGNSPLGANCLRDCGEIDAIDYSDRLDRGFGPSLVGTTKAGVNGLFDMGANVWEWVDSGPGTDAITRGGSWWYGAFRMHRSDVATKPKGTAAVYIGFRCAGND